MTRTCSQVLVFALIGKGGCPRAGKKVRNPSRSFSGLRRGIQPAESVSTTQWILRVSKWLGSLTAVKRKKGKDRT